MERALAVLGHSYGIVRLLVGEVLVVEHLRIGQQNLHGVVVLCFLAKGQPQQCDIATWLAEYHGRLLFRSKSRRCNSATWFSEHRIWQPF